jgi:hypothetical protein
MTLDIDFLIEFFKKYTIDENNGEIDEQDAEASYGGGGGSSVPKWADSYPLTRGKANRLGASGEKWETGLTRGAANQIW